MKAVQQLRILAAAAWLLPGGLAAAERINHAGRILGPIPTVTSPVLFNTAQADAILSAMQILPVDNPWNEDISRRPVMANSDAIMARIMSDLDSDRRSLIAFQEMNFVLVPDAQPRQSVHFFNYPDESDLDGGVSPDGLYPIPADLPIEGWPSQVKLTLSQWQQSTSSGDRHAIMVAPGAGFIWETWLTRLNGTSWRASNGAKFNLSSNHLRPAGWTSGDAAGLPMFPALPRFDECERGTIEHACRIVVKKSKYQHYTYPATHYAASSGNTDPNLPEMGQRVRLKAGFVIPANWTRQERAILLGLKKHGALVADNGSFFSISVTPDDRWPKACFDHFTTISITNFEVIQSTGPAEGPRSPGAPGASAGPPPAAAPGTAVPLHGYVSFTGAPPVIQWKTYSGPASVMFGEPSKTNSLVTFSAAGTYVLMLSADDGIHAVAYDAVTVEVAVGSGIVAALAPGQDNSNLLLTWTGGAPPFVVESTSQLPALQWNTVVTTDTRVADIHPSESANFLRVRHP